MGTDGGKQPLKGRKIADRRVRIERPHAPFFRYTGEGSLVAKAAVDRPLTPAGRFVTKLRTIFLGRPLANEEEIGERLSKTKALAIFSSDAISSSAYATEEILRVLILAGAAGARLRPAGQHRDRRPARLRRPQLPPGLHRLSDRRRLVLGLEAQLRAGRRRWSRPAPCSSTT